MLSTRLLTPGEMLNEVPGLKRHKLDYWCDKDYVPFVVETRSNRDYRFHEEKNIPIIKKAYELIIEGGMKDKEAFNRIYGQFGFKK